jgi:ABC-type lipoprotein release transport system permease subunit
MWQTIWVGVWVILTVSSVVSSFAKHNQDSTVSYGGYVYFAIGLIFLLW